METMYAYEHYMVLCANLNCGQYLAVRRFYCTDTQLNLCLVSKKKNNIKQTNNPVELAILYLHSHITVICLQKLWFPQSLLLCGITSCLFHSSPSLFYICSLTSTGIWICNIYLANNSLPGWLEFILMQLPFHWKEVKIIRKIKFRIIKEQKKI